MHIVGATTGFRVPAAAFQRVLAQTLEPGDVLNHGVSVQDVSEGSTTSPCVVEAGGRMASYETLEEGWAATAAGRHTLRVRLIREDGRQLAEQLVQVEFGDDATSDTIYLRLPLSRTL